MELDAGGKLGAIACPPKLLGTVLPHHAKHLLLMLYHADQLCMWRPNHFHYLANRTVYIEGDWRLNNHYGAQEHDYCHWLSNAPHPNRYDAWRILLQVFRSQTWRTLANGMRQHYA